jgi:chemosensory pili system protein ChpA (sensor histidine kinase/response regulator)
VAEQHHDRKQGPEVGIAELKSLDALFKNLETESEEWDQEWEEDISDAQSPVDFSEFEDELSGGQLDFQSLLDVDSDEQGKTLEIRDRDTSGKGDREQEDFMGLFGDILPGDSESQTGEAAEGADIETSQGWDRDEEIEEFLDFGEPSAETTNSASDSTAETDDDFEELFAASESAESTTATESDGESTRPRSSETDGDGQTSDPSQLEADDDFEDLLAIADEPTSQETSSFSSHSQGNVRSSDPNLDFFQELESTLTNPQDSSSSSEAETTQDTTQDTAAASESDDLWSAMFGSSVGEETEERVAPSARWTMSDADDENEDEDLESLFKDAEKFATPDAKAETSTGQPSQAQEADEEWSNFWNQDLEETSGEQSWQWEGSDSSALDDIFGQQEQAETSATPATGGTAETASTSESLEAQQQDVFAQLESMLAQVPALAIAEDSVFQDLSALLGESSQAPTTPTSEASAISEVTSTSSTQATPTETPKKQEDIPDEDLEQLLHAAEGNIAATNTRPNSRSGGGNDAQSGKRNPAFEQTMRVPIKQLDNLSNLVGELVVNRNSLEQNQERLRQFLDNLLHQVQNLGDAGQRMQDLYERSLLEISLLSSSKNSYEQYRSSDNKSSSSKDKQEEDKDKQEEENGDGDGNNGSKDKHDSGEQFDSLEMDRFTGFHTLSQEIIELIVRVREASSDITFLVDETEQVTRQLRQITTQVQEGLTRSRMVPFAQTADRLPRGVRDNAKKFGKKVELVVEGRDTLIDKMLVEQLYDPMTHLVNNAVAHGIETPEQREKNGKSPTGQITIRAFHQGNQTVIAVADDGAGINAEKLKTKALQKGVITSEQANKMPRNELYNLLFLPGFSTKDNADDLSGRGVGMDVVRTKLNELRGHINTDSALGKGTTFTIRLPLTLSISKALCCINERARIAFPIDGVEDTLEMNKDQIETDEENQESYISWRDLSIPYKNLNELLVYQRSLGRSSIYSGHDEDEDQISVIILRSAGNYLAVKVDRVLGEQEIVIKQLEGPVPKPVGIAGATVMGDGKIVAIADVLELIDLSCGRRRSEPVGTLWEEQQADEPSETEANAEKTEPTVLIVDDSITVRELLSMTFKKAGYRVQQARDGKEAWEKMRSDLPCDLVFCDIEMPRMDGLELLSRMQKDPQFSELPIAMLTSRGADRHRQMAMQMGAKGYFTKPYLEETLLDAAKQMLRGESLANM